MRALAARLSRRHTLSFTLAGLCLLCCSVSLSQAAIVVEDSPLYGLTLVSALSDLTDDPATATTRWGVDAAGRLVEEFFVTPAYAQDPVPTVDPGAPLCATHFQEHTMCEQDQNGHTKKFTQCDKSTDKKQVCQFTAQPPKKTDCWGATDRTVCKAKGPDNRSGTRCPGEGGTNVCSTNSPRDFTDCKKQDVATLCYQEQTQCRPGDRNVCHTFGPANEKTKCLSGKTVATLCLKEATACTKADKNLCKTTQAGGKLTGCPSSQHVTLCDKYPKGKTSCVGNRLGDGCQYDKFSLGNGGHVPPGQDILVLVDTVDDFWGEDATANLVFGAPGPVITDVTVFDSTSAMFYVDFPTEQYQEEVLLDNGTQQIETAGLLIAWWTVPAMDWLGIALLLALLAIVATLIRRRRGRQEA